jgi:hypothetical protein
MQVKEGGGDDIQGQGQKRQGYKGAEAYKGSGMPQGSSVFFSVCTFTAMIKTMLYYDNACHIITVYAIIYQFSAY